MFGWALAFFVLAMIAAALGFSSMAGITTAIAKIVFFVFLLLTLVTLNRGRGARARANQ